MARLSLDGLHVVALLGAVQGVFLVGALATKRRNRTAFRTVKYALIAVLAYWIFIY